MPLSIHTPEERRSARAPDPAEGLTRAQRAAIFATHPRVAVVAGPGTGKTFVISRRVARLLKSGERAVRIFALTFSRHAAAEMRERINEAHPAGWRIRVSTFHSFALRIMRLSPLNFGLRPGFTILDEEDAISWMKCIMADFGVEPAFMNPAEAYAHYSRMRNMLRDPCEDFPVRGGEPSPQAAAMHEVFREFQALKDRSGTLDYDDILVRFGQGLCDRPAFANALRQECEHVLLDEGQDFSPVQAAILRMIAPANLFIVGDPCQSIYSWRGCDPGFMARICKSSRYQVIYLRDNFRSGARIVGYFNRIGSGLQLPRTNLAPHDTNGEGRVNVLSFANAYAEAYACASWISRLQERQISPSQIAVLARASSCMGLIEAVLAKHGIPHRKIGGGTAFQDRREIKALICFLRLAINAEDTPAWIHLLSMAPRIGKATAARIQAGDLPLPQTLSWLKYVAGSYGVSDRVDATLATRLRDLETLFRSEFKKEAEERIERVKSLLRTMESYPQSIGSFLDAFCGRADDEELLPGDSVCLSTVHSAKGREWPYVWIIGAGDRQFPSRLAGLEGTYDEEHRLAFVAASRAKNQLVVSFPAQPLHGSEQPLSRFFPKSG